MKENPYRVKMVLCIAMLLKENAYGVIYPVRGFLFIAKKSKPSRFTPSGVFLASGNKRK